MPFSIYPIFFEGKKQKACCFFKKNALQNNLVYRDRENIKINNVFLHKIGCMKTLLTTLNSKYIHLNLAIRLLYELNKDSHNIEWKEFTIKEDKEHIADFCKDFELVAFSCYIWNITQTLEVARILREWNPKIKILLGGPEVSYEWEGVIALPYIDYIITGEGEVPFRSFLNQYPNVESIANLISKNQDGSICYTEKTENFNLEEYRGKIFFENDLAVELANRVLYIETSRGCPYKCEFCLASLDNKVRYLPNETLKANLLYLMKYGKTIKFLDRTFNIKKDFTIDIFQFILENHRPENVFQFEITADIVHPEIIRFIQEKVPKGLFRFEIGIQTVNQKANLAVSRRQNFEKTKAVILALQDKVEMHLDLIVGMAWDYWEDIKYSFESVFKLYAPELQLGFLKFLKGTPVRIKSEEHGFKYDPTPPYQIIESHYLSSQELFRITQLEHALEIYWNKKRATLTLTYITETYGNIFDFLLGLGVYFGTRKSFHRFLLEDIYDILKEYTLSLYPDDRVLGEMIALDYSLQHKVRPKALYLPEIETKDKNILIHSGGFNPHKYRYLIFPISFDFDHFFTTKNIRSGEFRTIIQYSGVKKPEISSIKSSIFAELLTQSPLLRRE